MCPEGICRRDDLYKAVRSEEKELFQSKAKRLWPGETGSAYLGNFTLKIFSVSLRYK
jgi:hypothetical protein